MGLALNAVNICIANFLLFSGVLRTTEFPISMLFLDWKTYFSVWAGRFCTFVDVVVLPITSFER